MGTRRWSSTSDRSEIALEHSSTQRLKIRYTDCRYNEVNLHSVLYCPSLVCGSHCLCTQHRGIHVGVACLDKQLTHDCTSLLIYLPHTHAITFAAHQSIPPNQHMHDIHCNYVSTVKIVVLDKLFPLVWYPFFFYGDKLLLLNDSNHICVYTHDRMNRTKTLPFLICLNNSPLLVTHTNVSIRYVSFGAFDLLLVYASFHQLLWQ